MRGNAEQMLIVSVPDSSHIPVALSEVYKRIPKDVALQCEVRRFAISFGMVKHLIDLRDMLEPYPGVFEDWCTASGYNYLTVMSAIRREEKRLLDKGVTKTASGRPIKLVQSRARQDMTRYLRTTLLTDRFDMLVGGPQEEKFLRWVMRRADTPDNVEMLRSRCERLAAMLTKASRQLDLVEGN